jgi:hypothetical protein
MFKFQHGTFIIAKAEMHDKIPNVWRIDGRNLIQKFESFQEDGKTYYRNVSTVIYLINKLNLH